MVHNNVGNVGKYTDSTLTVDGLDKERNFVGDGTRAPFVVFDVDRQENIAGPFSSRDLADQHRIEILAGNQPRLDAKTLGQLLDQADNGKVQIFAVAVESESSGKVDWYRTRESADKAFAETMIEFADFPGETITLFGLFVRSGLANDEITDLIDDAMHEMSYELLMQHQTTQESDNSDEAPHWRCCNCMEPSPHPDNGCVLHALLTVLRDRETHSESQLEIIYIKCDVDRLWDQLGGIIDDLGNERYLDNCQTLNPGK